MAPTDHIVPKNDAEFALLAEKAGMSDAEIAVMTGVRATFEYVRMRKLTGKMFTDNAAKASQQEKECECEKFNSVLDGVIEIVITILERNERYNHVCQCVIQAIDACRPELCGVCQHCISARRAIAPGLAACDCKS